MVSDKLTCVVRKDPDFQECDYGNPNNVIFRIFC